MHKIFVVTFVVAYKSVVCDYEYFRYENIRNSYEAKSKIHFLKNGSSIS